MHCISKLMPMNFSAYYQNDQVQRIMTSLLNEYLVIQVVVLAVLIKLGVTFYGLMKQRRHLQDLTKNFEKGDLKTNWLLGDVHQVSTFCI